MSTRRRFRIWRGDANGGEFRDYTTEVSEGMVVLDAVHDIQATQANDLACRWNCKAGKCGSCSAEVNGMPKLMCMTRLSRSPARPAGHHRADESFPARQGSDHRCVVEFRGEKADQEIQAASARRRRRHLADGTAGHRSGAGIPEMHRVLSLSGRLPRSARSSQARRVHRAALSRLHGGARDASARYGGSGRGVARRRRASAIATSPSAARRSARRTSRSPTTRSFH